MSFRPTISRTISATWFLVLAVGLGLVPPRAEAGINVSIDIQKLVNGLDADTTPGPSVTVGSNVTFTYIVTNTSFGQFPIDNVFVRDNNGTPAIPGDDFSPTFIGGDLNGDFFLDLGETWTYSAIRVALAGQYTNLGFVSGIFRDPIDTSGDSDIQVFDTDPGNYFGVAGAARVPEPATLVMLCAGLAALGYRCRRRPPHS